MNTSPQTDQIDVVRHYRPIEALIPAHWQLNSIVTSDNTTIYYRRTGDGQKPPLLLLHGFQIAGIAWLRTAKALEAEYDVIMPDFRGHGYSNASAQDFSLERCTQDTAELITKLGLVKPAVIGHSFGAEIAGRLAAEHSDLVKSVVLIDPPMRVFVAPPTTGPGAAWYERWIGTMQALKSQPHEERVVTALGLLPPFIPLAGEEDFVPFVEGSAQFNLDVIKNAAVTNYQIATPELASRVKVPLLLLTGNPQRGSGATPEGIAAITGSGTNREAISFEDAGHFIPGDQLDKFVGVVKDFLARH
jgi:N-formylmaleamate deformylase